MGVGVPHQLMTHLRANFKLKWSEFALQYLGTLLPPELSRVFDLNFPPLLRKIRPLLVIGLHSWFGRCNIFKMSILPKFLYLFQALPFAIPSGYLRQAKALFTGFM